MTERVYNFSPGPAVLPLPVLQQAQQELLALPGVGISILELSHRGKTFVDILEAAQANLRRLLDIPQSHRILFLQGGSRLQFSMVPMNLLRGAGGPADFILTGSWGNKARDEARKEGPIHIAWDGKPAGYDRLPAAGDLDLDPAAAYLHFTTNETIQGIQFTTEPDAGQVPLIADASSDLLCRPLPVERYGLIYACAQKNAGPAGVTIVIIREDLLARSDDRLPGYLNYRLHAEENSLYNTPPTFAIYLVGLVCGWLLDQIGGLAKMEEMNRKKARLLYEVIDDSDGFYCGHAQRDSRSMMNVTFRLPSDELQSQFLALAEQHGLFNLKGHRSMGGIRGSIYNAMPLAGVEALRDCMKDFLARHGGVGEW